MASSRIAGRAPGTWLLRYPQSLDSVGLGMGLRICISNLGGADAAGPRTMF